MSSNGEAKDRLFGLVEAGGTDELIQLLELDNSEYKGHLSVRNEQGRTALDIAALLGKVDILKALTGHGSDLNQTNKTGEFILPT